MFYLVYSLVPFPFGSWYGKAEKKPGNLNNSWEIEKARGSGGEEGQIVTYSLRLDTKQSPAGNQSPSLGKMNNDDD